MIAKIKEQRKLGIWYSEDDVFDYGVAKYVGSSALLVYFALCRHADTDGKAFPSVKLLMEECNFSNRVVAKSTQILNQFGLIEIERAMHHYNVYRVNSVKKVIALNEWKKIAIGKKPFAQNRLVNDTKSPGQVIKSQIASDEKSLGQVTKSHLASDEKSHKGLTIEGRTKKGQTDRQANTYFPCVNSKNDAKVGQSVDLDIDNLNWPIALDQNQIVMTALAKLPDDQARQAVLDVVAKKSDNGELQKPVPFLKKVVDNYLTGDFTPLEPPKKAVTNRSTYKPNECPFCNERGLVRFVDKCTGRFENVPCPHDPVKVEDMRKGRQIDEVKSSQFKSIGEILSRRVKDVDEVPF